MKGVRRPVGDAGCLTVALPHPVKKIVKNLIGNRAVGFEHPAFCIQPNGQKVLFRNWSIAKDDR